MYLESLSKHNHCLHIHTYYSWLTHQHYQRNQWHVGSQFNLMSDFYWHLSRHGIRLKD